MRRTLHCIVCFCITVLFCVHLHAQKKGDPVLQAAPQQPIIQKSNSVLSPALQKLYDNTSPARKTQPSAEKNIVINDGLDKYLQIKGNGVVIDITVKENMAATKASLQQLGLKVTGVYGRVISGIMPINDLPKLTGISTIQFARPAYKPMHQSKTGAAFAEQCNTNLYGGKPVPVISQGDTAQRSYLARKKYNVNGKGVKVGILSDSYDNLGTAAIGVMHGELPGPGNPFNFKKPVDVLEDLNDGSGTDEGRAMAEIVHDVAPGAELAFHTAFLGEADFAQGIQDLAIKGCKVIADDVFYYDEPFFQDGIIAQSVDAAKKKGVSYFSSAGNNYNSSYESDYRATREELLGAGGGTAHNFSAPGTAVRYYQPIYIPTGGSFVASFQWDQPSFSAGGTGCASDLDIYLVDRFGSIVAAGTSDNIRSGDPIEVFGYNNNTSNFTFFLVILKYAGPDPSRLKYNMYGAQFYLTTNPIPGILAPALVGHAKAEGAIATAAAFYLETPAYGVDTPKVEWFSSLSGVPNYFGQAGNRIAPVIRKKPEITAPDGGNTSFFDPFGGGDITADSDSFPNFFGTSAAAPHAAAVAALMIEAEKLNNLTPSQIKAVMANHTTDMDNIYTTGFDKGFDYNTGTGLLKADAAVGDVKFPNLYIKDLNLKAICSDNPSATRNWKIINPNSFEVETHWFLVGTNQRGTITTPPGESTFSTNTATAGNYQVPNIVILDWDDNFGFTRLDLENASKARCNSSSTREMDDEQTAAAGLNVKPMIAEVYPNPATTTFRVYFALADQQQIDMQLFSIDGKKLMDKHISQTRGIVSLDASSYKPGIYLLNIKQGSFNKTIKLIKQ